MSASSAVFGIPELLHQIISELPPFDIVCCQRVNHTWHKLITDSPFLQYKAWLRNDLPDPTQHVGPNDLIPKYARGPGYIYRSEAEVEHETKRFHYNINKHLHPIIVARIIQDMPELPRYLFDPTKGMVTWGFGGYLNLRPVLLRALSRWYSAHKSSEDKWGHMSLYRPTARRIKWEVPCSDGSGIPFTLEARHCNDTTAGRYSRDYMGHSTVVNKRPGEPLYLTLSDLMGQLDGLWHTWIDCERETHYLSHDGEGCDYDLGLPDHCLESSEEGEGEEGEGEEGEGEEEEGEEEDEEDEEEYEEEKITFGIKMTREEHIESCVQRASAGGRKLQL